jgi:hypothetical protein
MPIFHSIAHVDLFYAQPDPFRSYIEFLNKRDEVHQMLGNGTARDEIVEPKQVQTFHVGRRVIEKWTPRGYIYWNCMRRTIS